MTVNQYEWPSRRYIAEKTNDSIHSGASYRQVQHAILLAHPSTHPSTSSSQCCVSSRLCAAPRTSRPSFRSTLFPSWATGEHDMRSTHKLRPTCSRCVVTAARRQRVLAPLPPSLCAPISEAWQKRSQYIRLMRYRIGRMYLHFDGQQRVVPPRVRGHVFLRAGAVPGPPYALYALGRLTLADSSSVSMRVVTPGHVG